MDAEVGRHLFEKCINGILKNKLRILVTHQVQFLKPVSRIFLIKDGRVSRTGTYEEIIESGIYFAQVAERNPGSQSPFVASGHSTPPTSPGPVLTNVGIISGVGVNSTFLFRHADTGSGAAENTMLGITADNSNTKLDKNII